MNDEDFEKIVDAALIDFGTEYDVPMCFPNVRFEPGSAYIAISHVDRSPPRVAVGGTREIEKDYVLGITVEENTGLGTQGAIYNDLCEYFTRDRRFFGTVGSVRVIEEPKKQSGFSYNGFWRTPVVVRFRSSFSSP